ncbi:MAG: PorV/PorQ family protein [Rhodothermales bacterium]|nr:PorV/PorQ family protein [Rhodothermales bacterium]MBO6779923.1 PorV/PorQ family protein [Rhodothermales bacterium]
MRIILTSLLLLFLVPTAVAQTFGEEGDGTKTITKVATTSAQFLKLGVGARAIGLGGTFVAEASDLSAMYWNPAGLSRMGGSGVQFNHTQYLADINYSVAAFGFNLGAIGSIGASLIYLDSGDMAVRTTARPTGTGERFKVQDLAIQLTYARNLTDRFSLGSNLKYIREQIWHSTASAMAFDVGVLFTTPYRSLRLGASMANFGPKMQMSGRDILFSTDPGVNQSGNVEVVNAEFLMDEHALPLLFRVGLAWDAVNTQQHRVVLLTDAAHPNDNSQYVNIGGEYSFRDLVFLRGGFRNLLETDGEQGLTLGGGLNLRIDRSVRVRIDYAFADFGILEQTHWYTFNLQF